MSRTSAPAACRSTPLPTNSVRRPRGGTGADIIPYEHMAFDRAGFLIDRRTGQRVGEPSKGRGSIPARALAGRTGRDPRQQKAVSRGATPRRANALAQGAARGGTAPGSQRAHDSLLHACMELLKLRGVPATRVNQKPSQRPGGGWHSPGADPGCPDIIACLPPHGRTLLIECKTGKSMPTVPQLAFMQRWRDRGAKTLLIRSVDQLQAVLNVLTTTSSTTA